MTSENHFKEAVIDRMHEILRLLFMEVKDKLDARYGCFEIFGVDFLLTERDLSPVVMKVTSNPCLSTEMDSNKKFINTLLRDVITMVCDLYKSNTSEATPE